MLEGIGISNEALIVFLSAIAAALSFVAFALPMLNRSEQKERYKTVIEKKRKVLFESAKEELNKKGPKTVSAKASVASFFRVQKLAGDMGEKLRVQMLQAGIRNPMAPIFYLITQIFLPIFLCLFSMFIISQADEPPSDTMTLLIIFGAVAAGYYLPKVMIKNQTLKRQEEINLSFPDSLDMMLICVQGGIGLEQTVEKVASEVSEHSPALAEELGILSAEMAMLNDRRTALSDFGRRIGGYAKSFATALIQAEQYGTSVSQALRVMADELRDIRMANAEQKAAALPPKLTVPMILFFLPALFIVILGPAGIEASQINTG